MSPADGLSGRELLEALDEELERLPAHYREPLVLCYLDGLTRDEAAARLGTPLATLKTRLERGRKKLHDALTGRGVTLGAGLLTLAVASAGRATVSRLAESILAAPGSPPATVATLVREFAVNEVRRTVKRSVFGLLAVAGVAALGFGLGAVNPTAAGLPAEKPAAAKAAMEGMSTVIPDEKDGSGSPLSGHVFDAEGKPLAGAELLLAGRENKAKKLGVSEPDGRFTVTVPRQKWVCLVARAAGAGIDFVDLGRIEPIGPVELRLVKDNPIRGRVVDTQGKPVAGVSVRVTHIFDYGNNNLDPFLAEWKTREPYSGLPYGTKNVTDDSLFAPATTDAEGRFTIAGAGAERVLQLEFRGAGIAETDALVVNRAGFGPKPYNQATEDKLAMRNRLGMRWLLHSPEPAVVAEAEKPIRGTVTDKDTGKPLAGVKVTLSRYGRELAWNIVSATTDAQGRYEIHGARKGKAYMVEVADETTTGHMAAQGRADDTPGYTPVTIDLAVKKGVIVTGRVIDKSTGKPILGFVMTDALNANPFVKGYPEYDSSAWVTSAKTGADGTFHVVTFPGPVILMGGPDVNRLPEVEWFRYKPKVGDPDYPQYFAQRSSLDGPVYFGVDGNIRPLQGLASKVLEIKPGTDTVEQDIVLEPATALPVKILGPGGKPLSGTHVTGMGPEDWHRPVEVKGDTCAAYHLEGKPRLLVFYEPAKKLFGTLALKGDEKEAVSVKLGPGGSVKGHVVGEDGKPLAGAVVQLYHPVRVAEEIHEYAHRAALVETAADGNFRIDDVVPGMKFVLGFRRGKQSFEPAGKLEDLTAEPGKTTDAGEIKLKPSSDPGEE